MTVSNIFLGRIELSQGKSKPFTIWKDDEKIMSEVPPESECDYSEGSSEKLTEELEEDDTTFDEI